ncbi:DUF5395 family protein [Desulfovulcanus sp.]
MIRKHAQEDMTITHDGRNWIAWNDKFRVTASSLEELDNGIRARYREMDDQQPKPKQVFMAFDNSVIPSWIRPFANYYFNRIIEIY